MAVRRLASPFPFQRLGAALALCGLLAACEQQGAAPAPAAPADAAADAPEAAPQTPEAQVSYSAGYQIAEQFAGQFGEDFDDEAFRQGVADGTSGAESRVDRATFASARGMLIERRQARAEQAASENVAAAEAFLAENGARPEVTTTESGLQYEALEAVHAELVEAPGTAPGGPTAVDVTHYTGRLLDGTVFDSSEERGQPATFGLDQVIPGWTEALQLMATGERWKIWLPPELAYGARPPSPDIPPNALLEFEVELIEVRPEEG
ncbi:MAG: FKBP-type peptidyl-prolyl cis-trans isomerase [Pseudomonadales bacterium]|jgi:FKBP-type peptidyl-prolyl cis-trans isomerase|nr:FKBP-type peptidyl-prolyl cis-trans isomerase [Pseudomonadales bacterium]